MEFQQLKTGFTSNIYRLKKYLQHVTPGFLLHKGPDRRNFDNETFWDLRYSQDPELGSGVGSRGSTLTYKRELLQRVVDLTKPGSVLDIGCGDLSVSSVLPSSGYTGVDISSVVVQRNSVAYPTRRFVSGDFFQLDLTPADLTISLDVLIHLQSRNAYQTFIQKFVHLTKNYGIVAGYEAEPKAKSDITFFHEPLSHTLQMAAAHNIREIGAYRQVTAFLFESRRS